MAEQGLPADRLDAFAAELGRLVLGQQSQARAWLDGQPDDDDPVVAWLAMELRAPGRPKALAACAPPRRARWLGWLAYNAGDYVAADAHFRMAFELAPGDRDLAEAALGLGKVYTRSGHWPHARGWLLQALAAFRAQDHLFGVVQGYGALGELLLRAAHPAAAQACFLAAMQLLPPGSAQQPRQFNYLGGALLRQGQWLRAESLLMSALLMAADLNEADSQWHALARLQSLAVRRDAAAAEDVIERFAGRIPPVGTPVAEGMLHLLRGRLWSLRGDAGRAGHAFAEAAAAFDRPGQALPLEAVFARRLLAAGCSPAEVDRTQAPAALMELPAIKAPLAEAVVDRSFAELPLPAGNGFAALQGDIRGLDEEFAAIDLFFI